MCGGTIYWTAQSKVNFCLVETSCVSLRSRKIFQVRFQGWMEYSCSCFDFDATPLFHPFTICLLQEDGDTIGEQKPSRFRHPIGCIARGRLTLRSVCHRNWTKGWDEFDSCWTFVVDATILLPTSHHCIICIHIYIYIYIYIHIISCLRIIWSHTLSCPCVYTYILYILCFRG